MIHEVIRKLQKEAIPVQQSCRTLGVSRSGFYDTQQRVAKPVVCKESLYLKAVFMASHQSYGSRRWSLPWQRGLPHWALPGAQLDA